jgi:hypothetical protein
MTSRTSAVEAEDENAASEIASHDGATWERTADLVESVRHKRPHCSGKQRRRVNSLGLKGVGVDGMALKRSSSVTRGVDNCRAEQGGRDADRPKSAVNCEAGNPPRTWIVSEKAAQGAVALDEGHGGARHHPRPTRWSAVHLGEDARGHRGRYHLMPQCVSVRGAAGAADVWLHESLAPAPTSVIAALTEDRHQILPTLGGCWRCLDPHRDLIAYCWIVL